MTHKELIENVAKECGHYHNNKFYIEQCQKRYHRTVSPSSVTKTLGSHVNRLISSEDGLTQSARRYLHSMNNDIHLAVYLVRKAYTP